MMNKLLIKYQTLAVFIIYVIIFCILTWPLVINISDYIYAVSGDPQATLYGFYQSITNPVKYLSPEPALFNLLGSWSSKLFGEVATYNILLLLGFTTTALAGYILGKFIIKNNYAAFWLGLVLGVSPFLTIQSINHLNFVFLGPLLIFIYLLIRMSKDFEIKSFIFLSITFVITSLLNYQYGFFAIIIGFFYFIYLLIFHLKQINGNFFFGIMIFILISLGSLLPFNTSLLDDMRERQIGNETNNFSVRNKEELKTYSAQWLYYFLPNPQNLLFGNSSEEKYQNLVDKLGTNFAEQTIYLGWINISLAALLIVWLRKYLSDLNKKITILFLILLFGSFYFSFAPNINIFGLKITTPANYIFDLIPFFRVYARLGVVVFISLVTLSAIAFSYLMEKYPQRKWLIVFIIYAFSLVEIYSFSSQYLLPASQKFMPKVYKQIIDYNNVKLAEYPLLTADDPNSYEYLFWQRIHKKDIIFGGNKNSPEESFRQKVINPAQIETINQLKNMNVGYLIIHTKKYLMENPEKHPFEYNDGKIPKIDTDKLNLELIGNYDGDLLYRIK